MPESTVRRVIFKKDRDQFWDMVTAAMEEVFDISGARPHVASLRELVAKLGYETQLDFYTKGPLVTAHRQVEAAMRTAFPLTDAHRRRYEALVEKRKYKPLNLSR